MRPTQLQKMMLKCAVSEKADGTEQITPPKSIGFIRHVASSHITVTPSDDGEEEVDGGIVNTATIEPIRHAKTRNRWVWFALPSHTAEHYSSARKSALLSPLSFM